MGKLARYPDRVAVMMPRAAAVITVGRVAKPGVRQIILHLARRIATPLG